MIVRPARASDLDAWAAARAELWPDGDDRGVLREEAAALLEGRIVDDDPGGAPEGVGPAVAFAAFVAERDGALIGFAEVTERAWARWALGEPEDGAGSGERGLAVGYLEAWWVAPGARRRGVGRALVEACAAWARGRGLRALASDTDEGHAALSRAAHAGCGFVEVEGMRFVRVGWPEG